MIVASIHTSHTPPLVPDYISHHCLLEVGFLGANNFTTEAVFPFVGPRVLAQTAVVKL